MPQITCLSPSPSARVTITCDLGHSLLLLPRGVIYYKMASQITDSRVINNHYILYNKYDYGD